MSKQNEKPKKPNKKKQDVIFYTIIISLILVLLVGITIAYFIMQNKQKEDRSKSGRKNRNDSR